MDASFAIRLNRVQPLSSHDIGGKGKRVFDQSGGVADFGRIELLCAGAGWNIRVSQQAASILWTAVGSSLVASFVSLQDGDNLKAMSISHSFLMFLTQKDSFQTLFCKQKDSQNLSVIFTLAAP